MIYIINLFLSVAGVYLIGYFYRDRKLSLAGYFILIFPLIVVWLLIYGSQTIGTDYPSYIKIFNGKNLARYEPGFLLIVNTANSLGIHGQSLYYIFYLIGFIFFFLILRTIRIQYQYLFLFIFITFTGLFHNQLNILRQAIATYIGSYGVICLINKNKYRGILLILIASSIHLRAIILLFALLYKYMYKINKWVLLIFVLLSVVSSLVLNISIFDYASFLMPDGIPLSSYEEQGFIKKATKYIYIPLFIYSIFKRKVFNINKMDTLLFNFGIISFCIKLSLLNIAVVHRMADYFVIFTCFPLFYLLQYFNRKRSCWFYIILIFLIGMYAIKTLIFPSSEYLYSSSLPKIFM